METRDAVKWAGIYFGLWVLSLAVGGGFVVAGIALDALEVVGLGASTPDVFRGGTKAPRGGIVLVGVGVLLFQFGTTLAAFKAGISAVEAETARHFDSEAMKSDILAVLDDRLADIHQEVSQTRQMVNRIGREETAEEFDFGDEL